MNPDYFSPARVQWNLLEYLLENKLSTTEQAKLIRRVEQTTKKIDRQITTFQQAIMAAVTGEEWFSQHTLFDRLSGLSKDEAYQATKLADPHYELWIAFSHALTRLVKDRALIYRGHGGYQAARKVRA